MPVTIERPLLDPLNVPPSDIEVVQFWRLAGPHPWFRADRHLPLFFSQPFAHSESLPDENRSVALNGRLGHRWLEHAESHRANVRRCVGSPQRNALLGRVCTPQAPVSLAKAGFSG